MRSIPLGSNDNASTMHVIIYWMEHFLSGCPAFQTKACIICMISIDVFSGDRIKEKIVCTSLPHKFIHLSQDFVLCIQCLMHMNQKYVLKIHICRFIFNEFTNNTALFLLFSTVDTTLCDQVCQSLMAGRWFSPPIKLMPRYNWNIAKVTLNTITLTW